MLMRVPNYSDAAINGTLTSNAWDGYKYGVLAFRVNGVLSGTGVISANGIGFSGAPSNSSYGEGYAGYLANVGGGLKGGQGYENSVGDGGGGGHGTNGGMSTDSDKDAPGGDAYGNTILNPVFLGAGGGTGGNVTQPNPDNLTPAPTSQPGGVGGTGGGIVLAIAQTFNYSGSIQSKGVFGDAVANGTSYGGGGAGGSIRLETHEILTSLSLNATGGNWGGLGRVAVYSEIGDSLVTSSPDAYKALLRQGPTPIPSPTPIYLTPTPIVWSTGKDGNLTVDPGVTFNISTQNSNSRICTDGGDVVTYSVTGLSDSWASLSITPAAGCLKVGDELMLLNTQGNATYYTNVGNYEFVKVGGIVGNTVYFMGPKTKFYGEAMDNDSNIGINAGQQKVSLIRVPNYNNVTVNGTLTGLLVFRVQGTLSGSGTITADGLGYSGGAGGVAYYHGGYWKSKGGSRGVGTGPTGYGDGSGGSGGDTPVGGGGGAYVLAGGDGDGTGGGGGYPYGEPSLVKIYYGSGGGGGGSKPQSGSQGGTGGSGGGLIFILAQSINFSGTMSASGATTSGSANGGRSGGGGSGGSIRIEAGTITLLNNAVAAGGGGGTYGGVGSGGRIAVYYYTSFTGNFTPGYQEQLGVSNTPTAMPTVPTSTSTPTATPLAAGWYTNSYDYSTAIPHAVTSVDRVNFSDSFTYDENGNMICRIENGVTYSHNYNSENRASSIAKRNGDCTTGTIIEAWSFVYDGDGNRVTTAHFTGTSETPDSTTRYFFGGSLESTDGAVKRYYSFAGQTVAMKEGSTFKYFVSDHLGSTSLVLSASGTILEQQRYLPFGAPRTIPSFNNITSTDFTYTGQRQLDSGMGGIMDYKARFYSPYINRFLQPDTIIPDLSNPQSWNRYSYVRNNPVRYNDPTGHVEDDDSGDNDCDKDCAKLELVLKIQKKHKNVKIDDPRSWTLADLRAIQYGLNQIKGRNGFNGNEDAFNTVFGSVTFSLKSFPGEKAGDADWDRDTGAGVIRLDPVDSDWTTVVHEMGHLLSWTYKRQQKDDSLDSYAQMYPNVFDAGLGATKYARDEKSPGEDFADSFLARIKYGPLEVQGKGVNQNRLDTIGAIIQSYTSPDYGPGR
jgi:RHS repeat-associated protein